MVIGFKNQFLIVVICVMAFSVSSSATEAGLVLPLKLLQQLRAASPSPDRPVAESRILYYIAENTSDPREREKIYEEGRRLTNQVREADPKNPGALLWWTVHEGRLAALHKGLAALKAVSGIEKALLDLKEMNPSFDYGAADRALGQLYQEAPPFISVGSRRKAKVHLKEALRRFPDFPGNQVLYADFLLHQDEGYEARAYAQKVLGSPALEEFPLEAPTWRVLALRVLKKTRGNRG